MSKLVGVALIIIGIVVMAVSSILMFHKVLEPYPRDASIIDICLIAIDKLKHILVHGINLLIGAVLISFGIELEGDC